MDKIKKIHVISSFADDKIIYPDGRTVTMTGGPAFWIKKVFSDLGVSYDLFTATEPAQVNIRVTADDEVGQIVSIPRIDYSAQDQQALLLISTIGDEFTLKTLENTDAKIAIDIQGYNRVLKKSGSKLAFTPQTLEKIVIAKGTKNEVANLENNTYEQLKKKIFLITDGANDLTVFDHGEEKHFKISPVKAVDTIGAGDTFFAAFISNYYLEDDLKKSVQSAIDYTERFLRDKKS